MGWFDEQIRLRKKNDDSVFEEAFVGMADAVLGSKMSSAFTSDEAKAQGAIEEILKFYKVKQREVPDSVKGLNDRLEYLLRPHGIMRRNINLEKGWYKDSIGAVLGTRKDDGSIVAFIPKGLSGYVYFDAPTGKWVKLSKKTEALFEDEGICFYKPFPLTKLTVRTLMRYILNTLSTADFVLVILATLAVSLIGLLSPKLNNLLMGTIVESESMRLLFGITIFMVCVTISSLLIRAVKTLIMTRINTKMDLSVQAATMMRVLSLPADFFKQYSAGELSSRAQYIQSLCSMLISTVLNTGLTSIFSLIYVSQIFEYAPALVVPSLLIIFTTILFSLITTFYQMKYSKKQMEIAAEESGMSYALITGVQKIKLSGAEKRAYARWSKLYAKQVELTYNPPMFLRANGAFSSIISLTGALVMYFMSVQSGVSVADYYAFNTAYGMVSGAFMSLAGIATTIAQFKPILEMAKPIMDAVPEVSEGKLVIDRLSGGIELNNVSFRYNENMPLVVDNLSLKIRPGQYVAIVGATGCGKSTLMRIMLGFEKPGKGAVYYDGKDLSGIDLKSLRRKIGVVMQNGKLFQGDIFSNITISAPQLSMDEAWEAAEMAGIAEDIRRMPMGMHTIISEGSGGVSGGQRQRLMIARAIAPKPKILMFDEATSALDNLTQKIVSDSLDKLKCTRIVIAHRLSTIRQCDRIIYLEKGQIVEDGTYDELIAKNGKFAELVERQRLDN
ncbi:MAG: NHLP bacteriocin export ABC transporter permease/ATPase subunit [Clostridia bacterium]|nr:NHLP bacteriocin export ABC transporter permease/ATPase subunit [Clostridia bacterium]MBR4033012.1 NHLP bacteriocin export ABC transporter permease/ATPase subunit [Clostridia bacterium]